MIQCHFAVFQHKIVTKKDKDEGACCNKLCFLLLTQILFMTKSCILRIIPGVEVKVEAQFLHLKENSPPASSSVDPLWSSLVVIRLCLGDFQASHSPYNGLEITCHHHHHPLYHHHHHSLHYRRHHLPLRATMERTKIVGTAAIARWMLKTSQYCSSTSLVVVKHGFSYFTLCGSINIGSAQLVPWWLVV